MQHTNMKPVLYFSNDTLYCRVTIENENISAKLHLLLILKFEFIIVPDDWANDRSSNSPRLTA
jgi:hypothetical protein